MYACIYTPDFSFQANSYGPNVSDALIDCAKALSPRVEVAAGGTVVLDIEGLERLWGSFLEIATALSHKAGELGLRVNVAVASNPDTAIHAARGFAGITVIPQGKEADQLRDLPIASLSAPENIRETLARWGIRTFGAFAALPANDISVRLGDTGVQLHRQASGRGNRLLVPYTAPLKFVESMDLEYEITLSEPLLFMLASLLGRLCTRLKCRNLAAQEIHLTLESVEYVLRLPVPAQDSRLLLKLLQLHVESRPPRVAVSRIRVEAIPARTRTVQHGLFIPLSPEPEKLELTLARIAGIAGQENIGSPELLDTYRPGAFRMRRFVVSSEEPDPASQSRKQQAVLGFRTFRPPRESTVDMRDGQPRWIAFRGAHGPIVSASGPWRTSGNWWAVNPAINSAINSDNERWDRDEWDVGVSTDECRVTLYRIYCDHQSRRWYVEGVYD